MQFYTPIIIKFALGIICLIIQINLMGKGNLAPSSALDQVQNYVLGGIIGGVIYNDSITVLQFVLVLIIWTLLVLVLKFAKEHNRYVKRVVDGRPITLIQNGVVDVNECLKNGISANELMFKLRANGIYEVENVKRAVLEQNGQLTLIEFGDENIRYPIIVDGQSNEDVLELIKKDEVWLEEQIQQNGYQKINEIYLGEYLSGKLNLYGYKK
ncbi:DUF421 domain-containing protein [Enterococcus thailandicus]|uniref:DUF421 domain-containing protein n=1 Tax=Enterococcus thailandicus TaxID=417368 RepID=A0A1L8XQF0_ENTTH|nr:MULTISPECIES: DUF421 domain-containing protein [Enterococcus]ASZ06645.1 DUF421 domain-containing protein [Enterococcus thailandicus]MDK4351858.1 DUF421 domain-containing protein [Enterococcus thailandicus]MDT2733993.1 DUF421 domain-containing protein [Enterococcus thailandicus]MDT2751565.1 DUF421 domain-containing protein [Enterococcus thailandicus]MDT2776327.1 DUF421 domain-containing protein [Enterococcus thailandicus]